MPLSQTERAAIESRTSAVHIMMLGLASVASTRDMTSYLLLAANTLTHCDSFHDSYTCIHLLRLRATSSKGFVAHDQ